MPPLDSAQIGAPTWIDLSSTDLAGSRAFYAGVFGWQAGESDADFGGYFMFFHDGQPVAGCLPKSPEDQSPSAWLTYVAVRDCADTLARAEKLGGAVVMTDMPVGDLGRMGVFVDPDGATVGIWQPGEFAGFGVSHKAGSPTWFELSARNFGAEVAFYRNLFGWAIEPLGDTDDFRYSTIEVATSRFGGIHDAAKHLIDGSPAVWSVYFQVADTDAVVGAVAAHGGSVINPALETAFGRLAIVADPIGARFTLLGPSAG